MSIEYPENQENNVYYAYGTSGFEQGRVHRIEDASGAQELAYGPMGEIIRKTNSLVDLNQFAYTFSSFWQYDSWGRIRKIVYPDGEEVTYQYDPGGKLNAIHSSNGDSYLEEVYYDKFENKVMEALGNGTQMLYSYSADMRRLSDLKAHYAGNYFLNVSYSYDQIGNITGIQNTAGSKDNLGGAFSHQYSYDALYRLANANGSSGSSHYQLEMAYTPSGNIRSKTVMGQLTDMQQGSFPVNYNHDYDYNGSAPHQISRIVDQNSGSSFNFEWDLNGNMTLHSEMIQGITKQRRLCWDEENRLLLSADEEQLAGYVYDAAGMRTHKASGTIAASTVNGYPSYFGSISSMTLYPSELITVSTGMYTKHYYNGSQRLASRIGGGFAHHPDLNHYDPLTDQVELPHSRDYQHKAQALVDLWTRQAECAGLQPSLEFSYTLAEGNLHNSLSEPADGERYFYHSDHLGSSAFITTENGYATQFLAYMPFGETLNEEQNSSNYYSPFKFSAKEKDSETGYSYFGARYYSPELSVWLSVDPMAHKFPYQSGYTYCGWNPVKIIDPDGREEFELGNEKGVVKSVSQTQYFRDQKGNISTEKTDGTVEVDRVVDAKGREIYVEHGVLSKSLRNPSVDPKLRFYQFTNDNDAAIFFEFAARGSDVEWGYARQRGTAPSYVGTNEGEGHSIFGSFMEQIFGENLIQLMHSHPNAGGKPSANIMGPNDTKVGDLNSAFLSKYPGLLRKVFDPNENMTYSYDGSTLNSGRRYIDSWKGFKP